MKKIIVMMLLSLSLVVSGSYAQDTVTVKPSDTLWVIADGLRPDSSFSVQQVMLALLRSNPDAFHRGNINGLKAGVTLMVPDTAEMQQLSRKQAAREARYQYSAWKAGKSLPVAKVSSPEPKAMQQSPVEASVIAKKAPVAVKKAAVPQAVKSLPAIAKKSERVKDKPVVEKAPPVPVKGNLAAKVHLSTGRVTAATPTGDIREVKKDGKVFKDETVSTGPNSYVRMKFTDEGYILLRPNSRFHVKDYNYTGDKKKDKSVFSLLKGGFRAVTGAVGRADKSKYKVNTPVATIGIRGTDFSGRFCQGDCLDIDPPPPNGMYVKVHESSIELSTPQGTIDVPTGGLAFASGTDTAPVSISEKDPNPLINDGPPADPAQCATP